MVQPTPRQRRPHAAASARILTLGLSSAAAFGMVAGMAMVAPPTPADEPADLAMDSQPGAALPPAAAEPAVPSQVVVVVRRHWLPTAVAPAAGTAAPAAPRPAIVSSGPAPVLATAPAVPVPAITTPPAPPATQPAPRRVPRTRAS